LPSTATASCGATWDDGFSQRAIERRQDIDEALRRLVESKIGAGLALRTLDRRIASVMKLSMTRAGLRPPAATPTDPLGSQQVQDWPHRRLPQLGGAQAAQATAPDYLAIFKTAFAKTIRVAEAAGAKLVFVNIPAQATVCDGATHPWKKPVLDFVTQTGVDTIDLEKDFRNAILQHGREQVFAVPPCGGHFSELGYRVIGDRLLQYLSMRDASSAADHALPGNGWSRAVRSGTEQRASGAMSPSHQLVYAGTDLSEPELVAARRADAERWRRRQPNVAARVLLGAIDWVTARFATRMVFRHQQVYTADAYVDRPIKTDGSIVTDRDGAAIMGYSWQTKPGSSMVRIKVMVPAWSESENSIVAALFLDAQPKPLVLVRRRLQPRRAETALLDIEMATRDGQPVALSVRVAPGQPGTVDLNSDTKPSILNLSKPTLTIEEYAPFWR
jgi:hypothetical protein